MYMKDIFEKLNKPLIARRISSDNEWPRITSKFTYIYIYVFFFSFHIKEVKSKMKKKGKIINDSFSFITNAFLIKRK